MRARSSMLAAALLAACTGGSNPSVEPPSNLIYATNPAVYRVGVAITANAPSSSGGVVASYSVTPALPAGLGLDTTTGVISGAPSTATATATYTVTASNSAGSTTVGLVITVNPSSNAYVTVAQLNFWFRGPGCYGGFEAWDCSGKRNTSLTPALGATYDQASAEVIRQQIEWATSYGVDAFSIEWTTPRGIGASMEDVLDDHFLVAPDLHKMRWCIFYDLVLRLLQTPGLQVDLSRGMDFDNPDVRNTFVADLGRFASKYFSHPQYLKIDGRPVLYVWGTWNATGRYAEAFQDARRQAAAFGFDVYMVGDIILANSFAPALASAYDATTNFLFFTPDMAVTSRDVGEAAVTLDAILTRWERNIAGLKVAGRQDPVVLQPGFAPQFDDRIFREINGLGSSVYVPASSKDQVTAMAEVVRRHAQPAGSSQMKLVWLNTWNNWPETTTLEPTAALGPKYPAGNYQYDMVEVIRDVFGGDVFPSNGP